MILGCIKAIKAVFTAAAFISCGISVEKKVNELKAALENAVRPMIEKEYDETMKKSTFAAILVFLAAAAGALTAAFLYLRRREKELDEYEQLLFSDEFEDEAPAAEEAPAEEAPAEEAPAEEAPAEESAE